MCYPKLEMATAIQVKKEYAGDAKSFDDLLDKLDERYGGKWVAILENGEVIADQDLDRVYAMARKMSAEISFLFRAHKKDQLFFR